MAYLKTSDSADRQIATIDSDSEQIYLDTALVYWPNGVGSQLNLYGGVRYIGFDDEYEFSFPNSVVSSRSNEDYLDALVGARYRFELSERWGLHTRADLSIGDTEGSWMINAMLSYAIGEARRNRIYFGYQYKEFELEDSGVSSEYKLSGPIAGFSYRF